VQKRKDNRAAERFFKKLMKGQGRSAREIVTDKLPSYGAARKAIMSTSMHCCDRYANNRAEASHEHTRAQEQQMRRFKSPGQAQRFLAVHSQVHNLFRVGRHLLPSCQLSVVEKSIIRNVAAGDVRLLNGNEPMTAANFANIG
jgi:putative transposase